MRTVIFTLLFSTIIAITQGQKVYVNLSNASGKQIRGDASMKGFERWMEALTTNSGAKNNTMFTYTMNISGAAADLKRTMQNGEFLVSGQVTVLQPATTYAPRPAYIIKMEKNQGLGMLRSNGVQRSNDDNRKPSGNQELDGSIIRQTEWEHKSFQTNTASMQKPVEPGQIFNLQINHF